MKKFFTLFALLSVGLSAWAQTYTLYSNHFDYSFSYEMNDMKNGTYSLTKLVLLTNNEYYFWVKDQNNDDKASQGVQLENSYWDDYIGEPGWYALTFTFNPSNSALTITVNEGTVVETTVYDLNITKIFLSDDVTFGTYSLEEFIGEIEYTRFCKNEWGTLCLPFDFQPFWYDQFKDVTYYELKSATDEALVFSPIVGSTEDYVKAGTPLVFKLNNSNSNLIVRAWEIYSLNSQASTVDVIDGWKLNGTVEGTTIANAWVMQNNQIFQIHPDETAFPIKPYRAWFENPGASGAPLRISVDETEGLQFVEQEDGTVKVSYDLQGRKLDEARKGLMIENGKVIMVK